MDLNIEFRAHLELSIAVAAVCALAFDDSSLSMGVFDLSMVGHDNSSLSMGVFDLITVGPTLGTNILSTGLIAWKAWCARPIPRQLSLTMSLA
jgi:hypothetical protein